MSSKSSHSSGRYILGMFLITTGYFLQCLWPWHSLHYDISFVLFFAGGSFWVFGTYLFAPLLLITASAMLNLIPYASHQVSHTVNLVMIVLAVALGFWGWWRERRAKIAQKKLD